VKQSWLKTKDFEDESQWRKKGVRKFEGEQIFGS
jgi:hypothetical protein